MQLQVPTKNIDRAFKTRNIVENKKSNCEY